MRPLDQSSDDGVPSPTRAVASALVPAGLVTVVVLALRLWGGNAVDSRTQDEDVLQSGLTLGSDLVTGSSRRYRVPVAADRYLRVRVDQHGVDVVLRLYAPDGSRLVESDGVNGKEGPESVSLVSDRAGAYTLEVDAPPSATGRGGRIDVRVVEEASATPRNRLRVEADRRAAIGRAHYLEHRPQSLERAQIELTNAARTYRRAGDFAGEADSLYVVAVAANDLERHGDALAPLSRALELAGVLEDPRRQADISWMRGFAHVRLGEWRTAVEDLGRALPLFRKLGDHARQVRVLCDLGGTYLEMGDRQRAAEYIDEALRLARSLPESQELAQALAVRGTVHLWYGEWAEAEPMFEEALAISRRRGYSGGMSASLHSLGVTERMLGRHERARELLGEALSIARERQNLHTEAANLQQLAGTYPTTVERRDVLLRCIEAARDSRSDYIASGCLTHLADDSFVAGDLDRARHLVEEAVATRERLWRSAPDSGQQTSYLAEQFSTYGLYADVLAAIARARSDPEAAALAFSVVDGARARSLRQELARARVEIEGEVPAALRDRRRDLGRSLLAAEAAWRTGRETAAQVEGIEAELRAVEKAIASASPRWAALMRPEPLTVEEVQRDLLDSETVLLEYALGNQRSHLFVIGANSFSIVALPPRATIETAARAVTESVAAREQRPRFETVEERRDRIARADVAFAAAAKELSDLVLTPVAKEIAGKRIALVTDGALQQVPFGALPDPAAPGRNDAGGLPTRTTPLPLAVGHQIVHLPSATVLREIRRSSGANRPKQATVAVLADPVLRANDPRLRQGLLDRLMASLSFTATAESSRAAGGSESDWPDLPYARAEADAVLALAASGERLEALGFNASRATALSSELSRFRILHFATHVSIDADHPDRTGIVLSRFDSRGRPQPELLSLLDLYSLRLPVDLVVLSGCRSGLGKAIPAEGRAGLTRGFLFAGARRVVVSLWDVEDRATAELMRRFYSKLLLEGNPPAEALRAAQVELLQSDEWSAPYQWAGFVLEGDWR